MTTVGFIGSGFIGSGYIGSTLARLAVEAGHHVVQAAGGAGREDMHRVADQALSTWPSA
ncbi:hypothetical protein ABZT34_24930 [Streptomyces sp. NPDC005329]|uniref:hypothetical protein n=1 Tax=Streptomyces sp. NPDC005329 TaxID=3157034 RepID=UPI0033B5D502